MMGEINNDFVGIHPDHGGSWLFTIPISIDYISDSVDAVKQIVEGLFTACADFIRPTAVEYYIWEYTADGPAEAIDPRYRMSDIEFIGSRQYTIEAKNGIDVSDFHFESYRCTDDHSYFISEVNFTMSGVIISLNDYNGWVDRTDDKYIKKSRFGDVLNEEAEIDPISISLFPTLPSVWEMEGTFGYTISFTTTTNIWFEDTEIGRKNRHRLKDTFAKVVESLDIIDTETVDDNDYKKLADFYPR